jgi:GGDEF domain-containing protein
MILPQCNVDEARSLWHRVETALAKASETAGKPYRMGVSHGFAQYRPDRHPTADLLIAEADASMYSEKSGRSDGRSADSRSNVTSGRNAA